MPVGTHVWDWDAAGQGAPLVLIHGALADRRIWAPVLPLLAPHFRVLSYTQRYFGAAPSVEPHDGQPFDYSTHAADLLDFLADVAVAPAHVVGWSYGADVALLAALGDADRRIASLVLYEPGRHHHLSEPADLQRYGEDAAAMFGPVFECVARHGGVPAAVECLIDGSGGRAGCFRAQPDWVRQIELENAHTLPWQLQQAAAREVDRTALAHLSLPVALARGSQTRCLFATATDAMARALPAARHAVIEHADHLWPLEQPARFAAWVSAQVQESET